MNLTLSARFAKIPTACHQKSERKTTHLKEDVEQFAKCPLSNAKHIDEIHEYGAMQTCVNLVTPEIAENEYLHIFTYEHWLRYSRERTLQNLPIHTYLPTVITSAQFTWLLTMATCASGFTGGYCSAKEDLRQRKRKCWAPNKESRDCNCRV